MRYNNALTPIVLEHISKALSEARLITDPFPYSVIDNLFPDDFYSKLHLSIPPIEQAAKVSDSISRITLLPDPYSDNENWYYQKVLANAPDYYQFWDSFSKFLSSAWFMRKILDSLKIQYNNAYTVSARLAYDLKGSGLGPHRDREDKLASFVIYLAKSASDAKEIDSGTELLTPKVPQDTYSDKHYKFSDFTTVKTVDYFPNRLLGFAVKRGDNGIHSFHGYRQNTTSTRMSVKVHIHTDIDKQIISNMIDSTKTSSKDWENDSE